MITTHNADDVEAAGFAKFNGGSHLCVDIPDGHFTISCKTSEGKKVTFAFVPYTEAGPGQCVDIQRHGCPVTCPNGDSQLDVQKVICFGPGPTQFRSEETTDPMKAVTLTTLLLSDRKHEV